MKPYNKPGFVDFLISAPTYLISLWIITIIGWGIISFIVGSWVVIPAWLVRAWIVFTVIFSVIVAIMNDNT